jgi:hypothetical protein
MRRTARDRMALLVLLLARAADLGRVILRLATGG